ncbi:MAG: ABC transporter ATP-binding protein, partial [Pseudobdellovibrio sp.]
MAVIEVKDFCKSFGTKKVHAGVSFYVKKGECLGLVGGSGAGKSVILRSLIGLEKADSGQIIIEGTNVTKCSELQWQRLRKKVAYAFQGGALFDSMTVYQNLAYPLVEHTKLSESQIIEKIKSQLADFGLSGTEKLFPNELSGGMQKRVGLARAMMLEPDIILYDEPTAGLDPYNTRKIQELIMNLKK